MPVEVYLDSIDSETTMERKPEIQQHFHEYCKLDIFAMVRLHQRFLRHLSTPSPNY